jgi:hypothetical protein
MSAIIEGALFRQLLENSCVQDPIEALSREFFSGRIERKSPYAVHFICVTQAALTPREIEERLRDPSFCQKCFKGDYAHYFDCPLSPWRVENL